MSNESQTTVQPAYAGGNELFFALVAELVRNMDNGKLSAETLQKVLQDFGQVAGRGAKVAGDLGHALNAVADALGTMGLVRVFEPADPDAPSVRVLVLRCAFCRIIGTPRVREGKPYFCALGPIVEGMLAAGGNKTRAIQSREGMIRADECILNIEPLK